MPWRSRLTNFIRTLFRRDYLDRDLNEELDGFVEDLAERKMCAGNLSPHDARRAARRELGSEVELQGEVRETWLGHRLYVVARDLALAWRTFCRAPGFAATAVLTLGLGIGASAAIFAIVDSMLIERLPYRDSQELVFIWSDMSDVGYPRAPLSGPELKDLRERANSFVGFGAIWSNTAALTGQGDPEQLRIGFVTTNFFPVLGADAALGRTFAREDEEKGTPRTILLSWPLWQRRFGGDGTIVGRKIQVNGAPATVIGVMPRDFRLLLPTDSAIPDDQQAWLLFSPGIVFDPRGQQYLRVVGRLKPGASFEQGRQEVTRIAAQISHEFSEYGPAGRVLTTVPLHADDVREFRTVLWGVFSGAVLLLMIACINVGSLLIARAAGRRREIAVRMALGARTSQLFQQCLLDGLLLAFLGAVAGIAAAQGGLRLLLALRPVSLDRIAMAHIGPRVLLFTAGTAILWGLLLSLAPLDAVRRRDVMSALQAGSTRLSGGRQRVRSLLVVLQIALSLVLAVSAVLMQRTFTRMLQVDPGFDTGSTLSFRLALPGSRYRSPDQFNGFGRQLEARLGALPGVVSTGAISHLPYDTLPNWGGPYATHILSDNSDASEADYRAVTPRFFETLKVPLIEGRDFAETDQASAPLVVVVDDLLARRAWPGLSPVGRQIFVDPGSSGHPKTPATVIGVVHHLRLRSLTEDLIEQVFFSERQILRNPMAYVIRSRELGTLNNSVRQSVAALDGQLPIYDVRPLSAYLVGTRATRQFTAVLATVFAVIAIVLATVGIYGVIAYSVNRRRFEFGIRMALGARPTQIHALVLREGTRLTTFGILLGIAGAAGAAHLLRSELFGVSPGDPLSYLATSALLGLVALVACWVPARHATSRTQLSSILRRE